PGQSLRQPGQDGRPVPRSTPPATGCCPGNRSTNVQPGTRTGAVRIQHAVDDVDRRLIDGLRGNARATYAELARRVGLSPPAVHERVAKLEASGVITGYHAAVAPAAVGLGVSALVGIRQSEGGDPARIAGALEAMPEIEDCWVVAGDETFVVKVRVADVPALEHVIAALARIRGVARARTPGVLSTRFGGRGPAPRPAAPPAAPRAPP